MPNSSAASNGSSDFKIGLTKDLKIIAYEATFHQNAGASADLSPAVLERTLFHCTNSYFIPNVTAEMATKAKAKTTDKNSGKWVGPDGQTIYVDDASKYYWINEKGGREFVTRSQLRAKQK